MEEDFPTNCKCVLSDKPGAGFCAVMVLDLDEFEYLCTVGGSKWERHAYTLTMYNAHDEPVERHMASRHAFAAVGGKVYYEFTGNELVFVEFDPADPEPIHGMIDIPDGVPMWSSCLVESCGELFQVVIFDGHNVHKVAEVAVYRMDFSTPAWCKVDRIGDRATAYIFLNHFATNENFVRIIDLEKETQEVQRPFKDFVESLRPPFWMLPTAE
ncbi:uncharacterized protein C2845_PM06G08060 [Panicum miliaceum]|uniref:KIB1-4 beta-propeller domain-containing protein n=1 Tax=Panicum miliaceum TaxID=4540 RepID=A0A3L6RB00_PANMI|nr:uncharacterized protein C2845_PM06G08060 [Panicum miliaceum]